MHSFRTSKKIKLLAIAFLVETFYLILAFIPASAFAVINATFLGKTVGATIGLVLFIAIAWLIQPDPIDDREDIRLPNDSPLYAIVNELSKKLDAPLMHRIVLNDELNASAYASQGFFSLFGVRRIMYIGVPLLRLLSSDELKAIVAHELGHFSRQHDRMHHWVYRVQYKWGVYLLMHRSHSDSYISSMQKLIAHKFIPYFLKQSSSWSHACEYEADSSAKSVGLEKNLIAALAKMDLQAYLWHTRLKHDWTQWQYKSSTPHQDILDQINDIVQNNATASFDAMLDYAKSSPRGVYNTHPRLQERALALKASIDVPMWIDDCAGQTIFVAEWQQIAEKNRQRWLAKHQDSWRINHYRLQWLKAETETSTNKNNLNMQAISAATFLNSSESIDTLHRYATEQPDNAYLQFELGRCLLNNDNAQGLQHLQQAMKLNKKMAVASLQYICDFHTDRDDIANIKRSLDRLSAAYDWSNRYYGEHLFSRFCSESLTGLSVSSKALFTKAIENDSRIDGCWAASLQSETVNGYAFTINLVAFRLDPSKLHESHQSEDHVRSQVASLLAAVCPPDVLVWVKSVFYTEPFNPNLLSNFDKHPEVCIVRPKGTLNADIVKIDVL